MTSTPGGREPDADESPAQGEAAAEGAEQGEAEGTGAEMGVSEGEGSTFEPEEDPEAHG